MTAAWLATGAQALDRTWIGGDGVWIDGGSTANWDAADEPDADDTAIFNSPDAVDLGSNNEVVGLTMSGGIDLDTDDFDLTVGGLVQLTGASTNLFIRGAQSEVSAEDATINAGGAIELGGGSLTLNDGALFGVGVLNVNGGSIVGHGAVSMVDAPLVAGSLLNNNGTITAVTRVAIVGTEPPANTLSITAAAATARIDLDGSGENGVVNVNRNQTLDVNGTLTDEFNGTMSMTQDTRLDISTAWTLGAGGAINVDNGESLGIPTIPAGTSIISGGALAQTGGTITVVDPDGELIFDAPLTVTGGTFTNNGHVTFNASSSVALVNFDFDAGDWTIQNNSLLSINVGDYDPGVVNNAFDASLTLNNGDISVTTGDSSFVMDGTLNMVSTSGITVWTGETVDIGNDGGSLDAKLNVSGTQISRFASPVDFNSDADVNVASGATLEFTSSVKFETVNAANHASFAGGGTLRFHSEVGVFEAVTLSVGTVDLDGSDSVGDQITLQAPLVINAETFEPFGKLNNVGINLILVDALSGGATGSLTINLDDPNGHWTLDSAGVISFFNSNAGSTQLTGADADLQGSVNVTGSVGWAARVDMGGNVFLNSAAGGLLLQGGTLDDPNRLVGGTIQGPGELRAVSLRALHGYGNLNAPVDFDGTSTLWAEGGDLAINGAILDVGLIGAAEGAAVVVNTAWNTTTAVTVLLEGGELRGNGTVTTGNETGIQGYGVVSSRLVNDSQLLAGGGQPGHTLLVQTANNDNDWDGTTNMGELGATSASTLELRDVGSAFGFGGSVVVGTDSRVYANGFALDFNPGSSISLSNGIYESTNSTDIGGTVTVGGGSDSTIKVQNNSFLVFETGSATTLNADLRLENNNIIIEAGATFAGGGTLIVPDGSHIAPDDLAEIGVGFQLAGSLRPAQINNVARVEFLDYQQTNTGKLYVDLTGNGLGDIDRLVVEDTADIDGFLEIDVDDGFEPKLGDLFPIITAATRLGEFDYYDIDNINEMPDGLTFKINYLPNAVQLEVVVKEFFEADFDEDGDVDLSDYAMWKSAFGLNQLGDANGDNVSDAADYTIWRNQLGSVSGGGAGSILALEQSAVPEAGTWALVALAVACVGISRWTR